MGMGVAMKYGVLAAAMLAFCVASSAATYDDFARGVSAYVDDDNDAAVDSLGTALKAGDLPQPYLPVAHTMRGDAYLHKDMCSEALAEADAALGRDPHYEFALQTRISANKCLGKLESTIPDYETLIALKPAAVHYDMAYGLIRWALGQYAQAAALFDAPFERLYKKSPHTAYFALWYAINVNLAGLDNAKVEERFSKLDISGWPSPIVDYYSGKIAAEKLDREAADDDPEIATNHKCEADFYIAEWQIVHKDRAGAIPRLQAAVAECPKNFTEASAAKTELERK